MDIRREDGVALIVALMATMLMTALGVALILTTSTETMITANYRNGQEALYAADAALERAMDDILTVPDWNNLLNGSTQSAFIDGGPSGTINSQYYVVVLVGDDPSDDDNDPLHDGGACDPTLQCPNPGTGVLSLRAEAFGPRGAHKVIEMTVARTDTTNLERGYTGQRGQDEQNRRARKAAVQTPGKALTQQEMGLATGGIH
jgi:hypothetical protein